MKKKKEPEVKPQPKAPSPAKNVNEMNEAELKDFVVRGLYSIRNGKAIPDDKKFTDAYLKLVENGIFKEKVRGKEYFYRIIRINADSPSIGFEALKYEELKIVSLLYGLEKEPLPASEVLKQLGLNYQYFQLLKQSALKKLFAFHNKQDKAAESSYEDDFMDRSDPNKFIGTELLVTAHSEIEDKTEVIEDPEVGVVFGAGELDTAGDGIDDEEFVKKANDPELIKLMMDKAGFKPEEQVKDLPEPSLEEGMEEKKPEASENQQS